MSTDDIRDVVVAKYGEAARQARNGISGCCKLTLEVLDRNRVAMSAYISFGFVPYALDPAAGSAVFLQKLID